MTSWVSGIFRGQRPTPKRVDKPKSEALRLRTEVVRHYARGRNAEAVVAARRLVDWQRKAMGPKHKDLALGLTSLARLLQLTGDRPAAIAAWAEAGAIRRDAFGPNHPETLAIDRALAELEAQAPQPPQPLVGLAIFELFLDLERARGGDPEARRECLDFGRAWFAASHPGLTSPDLFDSIERLDALDLDRRNALHVEISRALGLL